jgi:hypothetical protein
LDLGPLDLLPFCHFAICTRAARRNYRGHFPPTSIYSGCGVTLVFTSHLLVTLPFSLTLSPLLLDFAFELHALLVVAIEGEGYLLLDIVGDVLKVPLSEVSMTSTSSDDTSGGAASDDAETQVEDTIVMDPRESTRSYDFGASSITPAPSINWSLYAILSRVLCMNQERRLFQSRPTMKPLFLRNFLPRGFECHLIRLSPRSCLSVGCSCIS